jgi:thiol-disulfide isomerase/thioredoxin
MKPKSLLFILLFIVTTSLSAQLTYSPEKPKPGDKITFTYTPPPAVFTPADTIKCVAVILKDESLELDRNVDPNIVVTLKKDGTGYKGEFTTSPGDLAVALEFTTPNVDFIQEGPGKIRITQGKVDTNNESGYCIPLYTPAGVECEGSAYQLGLYLYAYAQQRLGFTNKKKGIEFYKHETELGPKYANDAYRFIFYISRDKEEKEELKPWVTKELNRKFETGIQTEKDYQTVATLAGFIGLGKMGKYFTDIANEKFINANGLIHYFSVADAFEVESDRAEKEKLLNEALDAYNALSAEDKNVLSFNWPVDQLFLCYLLRHDNLEDFEAYLKKFKATKEEDPDKYYSYDTYYIDTLIARGKFPGYTEKMALEGLEYRRQKYAGAVSGETFFPTDNNYIKRGKIESAGMQVATLTDACARVYQQQGEWKKALPYAKESLTFYKNPQPYMNRIVAPVNERYCVIAENVLPAKQLKPEIENFVRDDRWTPEMIDILRRLYVKEKKSEAGFDEYVASLKKANLEEKKAELLAEKINIPAPDFTLIDTDGNTVTLSQLKGKVVILDFWATWCGPCKVSFPAMQLLVDKYKNNPEVKILFVNVNETGTTDEEKLTRAKKYIADANYTFQVLMDYKGKSYTDYAITGIPTKCIIDKNGMMRYKIVGAETNAGKLLDEMEIMINLIR